MNIRKNVWLVLPVLVLASGCKKEESSEPTPQPTATAAPTPTATQAPTVELKPENPTAKPGIEARVKAEVDNRSDGIAGAAMAATGAKATVPAPGGWASSKSGDFAVATSADKKAQLAAAGAGADKLDAAAAALGLSGCQWNGGENVTVGKDKLPSTAADGTCQKGTVAVKTAYVATAGENLLVVGAFEPDGDANNVFGAMRAIAKSGGGGGGGLAACCSALRQNAKSAPPEQQGAYLLAAGACDAARNNPNTAVALGAIRAALRGAAMPGVCQ